MHFLQRQYLMHIVISVDFHGTLWVQDRFFFFYMHNIPPVCVALISKNISGVQIISVKVSSPVTEKTSTGDLI